MSGRTPVGLAPKSAGGGRTVVGLAPGSNGASGRTVVGLAPTSTPKQGGHHSSFLGHVAGIVNQGVKDLGSAAYHAPGGLYHIGKAAAHDSARLDARLGIGSPAAKRLGRGDYQLPAVGRAAYEQTKADLRHPLRHPGYTLLDLSAVVNPGVGAVGRGAEAGRLARAGELGSAAKALGRRRLPPPRLISHDGLTVKLPASAAPLNRAIQHGVDRLLERFPNVPLVGAAHVVGKENARAVRYVADVQKAPVAAFVAKARGAGLLKRAGKVGPYTKDALARQHALRVVAEDVPVKERVAFHEAALAKGYKAHARNAEIRAMQERDFVGGHEQQITLNKSASKHLQEVTDHHGVVHPRLTPELAHVYEAMLRVTGSREGLLQELDRLDPGAAAGRLSAPGRVLKGARFEAPLEPVTLENVKLGDHVYAPGSGTRGQVIALDRKAGTVTLRSYNHAAHDHEIEVHDLTQPSDAAARARLAELDRAYETLIDKIVPEVSSYGGDISRREQLARNYANSRPRAHRQETVRSEERQTADETLHAVLARNPDDPGARQVAEMLAERERLQSVLNERGEAALSGETPPPLPPELSSVPSLRRRGSATLTGAEDFAGGEARIPTVPAYKGRGSGRVPPPVGSSGSIAFPREPATLHHPYTGAAYRGGKIRTDVVRLVAESALEAQRYWTLLHVVDELRHAAKEAPTSVHDVPIVVERLPGQPSMAEAVRRLEESGPTRGGMLAELSHGYEGIREAIFPKFDPMTREALNPAPGIGYVDSRLLGGLNEPNPLLGAMRNPFLRGTVKVIDGLNNASKLAILYLKPAYLAPNLLGNVALNLVQQGFAAPANLLRAARLNASVGRDTAAAIDAAMGEGISASLEHYAGRSVTVAAAAWSKVVDMVPRRAAFLHEARRAGIKRPEQLTRLFEDPARRDTLEQVQRRAMQEIIDYGNLGPAEAAIVRRVIFFYPWVKGATVWTVHFLAEHPAQAGAAEQLGQLGQRDQQAALGNAIPAWAQSLVPTGTGPHGLPLTVNPAGTSVLQTPAELIDTLRGLAGQHTGVNVASNLSPALAAVGVAARQGVPAGARSLVADLPAVVAAERATGHRPSKTFPFQETPATALLQFLVSSGLVPRETDPARLRAGYYSQVKGR